MNREIKFRCWDKKESKWLFGYEYPNLGGFNLWGEIVLFGQLSSISLERLNDIETMQFTGLFDKLGKEIYEGDVLNVTETYIHPSGRTILEGNYKLEYLFGGFGIYRREGFWAIDDFSIGIPDLKIEQVEVIGNIHEHYNLLKV